MPLKIIEIIMKITMCFWRNINFKTMFKPTRSLYLLFTFGHNLQFILLPATNSWTNQVLTNCHLHIIFHTYKLYDSNAFEHSTDLLTAIEPWNA